MLKPLAHFLLAAVALEIEPAPSRHPYCLEYGCASEHVLEQTSILFCGGCRSYPSDLSKFASFAAPHVLLQDTLSANRVLKMEDGSVNLQKSKFGQAAAGLTTETTSALASAVMEQCKFTDPETPMARAAFNHVFFIPIETLHGLTRASVALGDAFLKASGRVAPRATQEVEWRPSKVLSRSANPEGAAKSRLKRLIMPSAASKSFLMMRVGYEKSRTEIDRSSSPGVSDAIPAQVRPLMPEVELLTSKREGVFGRNPLAGLKWVLVCDGFSKGAATQNLKAISSYRSFQEIDREMASLISIWKNAERSRSPGPLELQQAVIQKRNFVLSRAAASVARNLGAKSPFGLAAKISASCAPHAARFASAMISAAQAME